MAQGRLVNFGTQAAGALTPFNGANVQGLVALRTLALGALVVSVLALNTRPSRAQTQPIQPNVSEAYLKTAADQERAAIGLPPLLFDRALSTAARQHAALMVEHNSISHKYPGESDLARRAADEGARFSLVTENVAQAPSALLVHSAWMHSEGHRHNLLDPNVDSVGIAVVARNGQMFAVEDFARTVAALPEEQQEAAVRRIVSNSGLPVDAATDDARQVCSGASIEKMERPPEFVMRYTTDNLEHLPDALSARLRSGRYSRAIVAACTPEAREEFSLYRLAVMLYRNRPAESRGNSNAF